MSTLPNIKWQEKSKSGVLFFSVIGFEVAFLVVVFILDIYFHLSLYTFGRFMHFFILCYFTLLLWSGLPDGELARKWQVVLFVIIPLLEFFLINLMGISNLWGLIFVAIYGGVIATIFNINISNSSSSGNASGNLVVNIFGKVIKNLTK